MIFSQRYHRAIREGRIVIDLPQDIRPKTRTCIEKYNEIIGVKRDPYDNFIHNSSVVEEAILELMTEYGWDKIPGCNFVQTGEYYKAFRHLIGSAKDWQLFDFIELALKQMQDKESEECRKKINQIFDIHQCPWRIADSEFFKLDADFVGERLASQAHDALTANKFYGAADEYAKARQHLASGDIKDAIFYAGKSFESIIKVLTGKSNANADQLIKGMLEDGYFDDLPEEVRKGFCEQVLKSLPTLRNRLGGHGQGSEIMTVPNVYGDLALQMAAAFHNFLISKYLERNPVEVEEEKPSQSLSVPDDEIPF